MRTPGKAPSRPVTMPDMAKITPNCPLVSPMSCLRRVASTEMLVDSIPPVKKLVAVMIATLVVLFKEKTTPAYQIPAKFSP